MRARYGSNFYKRKARITSMTRERFGSIGATLESRGRLRAGHATNVLRFRRLRRYTKPQNMSRRVVNLMWYVGR